MVTPSRIPSGARHRPAVRRGAVHGEVDSFVFQQLAGAGERRASADVSAGLLRYNRRRGIGVQEPKRAADPFALQRRQTFSVF